MSAGLLAAEGALEGSRLRLPRRCKQRPSRPATTPTRRYAHVTMSRPSTRAIFQERT
jgi:hypothetical protein